MHSSLTPSCRYIVHLDMDAFFASVEQRDHPELRGKPVIIGADPRGGKGRGVVATCSYEARAFGVHSAQPVSIAYKKCPQAVFLPGAMEKYHRVFEDIYRVLYDFTPDIEPVSIDEFFCDITGSFHLFGSPRKTCRLMKETIRKKIGLTASIGLASTKMAAKIASDLKKPDGLVEVNPGEITAFLWPLAVGKIGGLGKKGVERLLMLGVHTIGDLARIDEEVLVDLFGKGGRDLACLAQGIDERSIITEPETKSISNERTFLHDQTADTEILSALSGLAEKVSCRLREHKLSGRTITLKIRLEGFITFTRSLSLPEATSFFDDVYGSIKKLYYQFERKQQRVRLVGVKVSRLTDAMPAPMLFVSPTDDQRKKMHQAVDAIRKKFGEDIIHRANN